MNSISFKLKSSLTNSISQSCPLHSVSRSLKNLPHSDHLINPMTQITQQTQWNPKTQREKHQETHPKIQRETSYPVAVAVTIAYLCCQGSIVAAFAVEGLFFLSSWFGFFVLHGCLRWFGFSSWVLGFFMHWVSGCEFLFFMDEKSSLTDSISL